VADITNQTGTIWLGDSANPNLASATFALLSPPSELQFTDQYGRPAGMLLSTPTLLTTFASWAARCSWRLVPTYRALAPCGLPDFVDSIRPYITLQSTKLSFCQIGLGPAGRASPWSRAMPPTTAHE
jgi:hypothetical protein